MGPTIASGVTAYTLPCPAGDSDKGPQVTPLAMKDLGSAAGEHSLMLWGVWGCCIL